MKEKVYNIVTSLIIIIYVVIALGLFILLPKYNLFFKGWWTFVFIIIAFGNLLFQKNKINSLFIIISGILIFCSCQGYLGAKKCFTIVVCLGIILLGIYIIKNSIMIPRKGSTKELPFYKNFLADTDEIVEGVWHGGVTTLVGGHLGLDLRKAKITEDIVINATSVLGETELCLPSNCEVKTSMTNILGGVSNSHEVLVTKSKKKKPIIYVNSISILGGLKIK